MMNRDNMDVDIREKELILAGVFDAPPKLMFEVWSSCEHLKHWWGPEEWPMEECEMDFREGGEWCYCLRGPKKGDESWGKAIYQEIDKPGRIAYRDHFTDSEGVVNEEMPNLQVSVEFAEQDSGTRQVMTLRFESAEHRQNIVEMGFVEGMTSSLNRLEEHLAQAATGAK